MAVYVDPNLTWVKTRVWRYDSVSHMYADSPEELHAFAAKIGLKRQWASDITQPDSGMLHYDLSPSKRRQAVAVGAMEVGHFHKFEKGYHPPLKQRRKAKLVLGKYNQKGKK